MSRPIGIIVSIAIALVAASAAPAMAKSSKYRHAASQSSFAGAYASTLPTPRALADRQSFYYRQ